MVLQRVGTVFKFRDCQSVWLNSDKKEQKRHRRKVYSVEEGI